MSAADYDAADNSRRCYDLVVRALREIAVRRGQVSTRNSTEERWAKEGPRAPFDLDTVRNG